MENVYEPMKMTAPTPLQPTSHLTAQQRPTRSPSQFSKAASYGSFVDDLRGMSKCRNQSEN